MNRQTVSVNGGTLAYDITGSGPPVVLISGGGTLDRRGWDGQIAALSSRHTVVRYDIRGIGGSSRPDAPFSHSDDLYTLLIGLGIAPACVIGLSMGAAIALDVALDHPEAINGLILAAPGLSSDREAHLEAPLQACELVRKNGLPSVAEMIVSLPAVLALASADVREKVKTIYLDNAAVFESDYALARLWQPTTPAARERISSIRVPTLILVGDRDSPDVRETVSVLAANIHDARSIVVPGAAHLLNLDAPDAFNQAVGDFLNLLGR
jgi:pimeloyl-ACP methyl ester carboxylesterase